MNSASVLLVFHKRDKTESKKKEKKDKQKA